MGLWDSITDVVDDIGEAVSDAAESVYDSGASSWLGDGIAWAAESVDTATFGLASDAMNLADDYVFDTVDYVTGGAVNIDFDGDKFSVGAGWDGLVKVGTSIGEAGITAEGDLPVAAFDVGLTDDGLYAGGEAGIDWGPLPYANGHVEIDSDGNVMVDGHVQGTIPTPYGILSGQVSGGFVSTDQGWGTFVDADGQLQTPTGITIGGGLAASYEETAQGSHASVGVDGEVSYLGLGSVGGSAGYERIEQDGDVAEGFNTEAHADVLGMTVASAEGEYVRTDIDGIEQSDWSGDVSYDGPTIDQLGALAGLGDESLGTVGAEPADQPAYEPGYAADDFSIEMGAADDIEASLGALTENL
jgi:hypothetical protein